jgi:hypothetical protein
MIARQNAKDSIRPPQVWSLLFCCFHRKDAEGAEKDLPAHPQLTLPEEVSRAGDLRAHAISLK